MARRVNFDEIAPGYYYTPYWDELIDYVVTFLRVYNSCALQLHLSAMFTRHGERARLHLPPFVHHLDKDMPMREFWDIIFDEIHDVENYAGASGSGWAFDGDFTYYFDIQHYQPMQDAQDNNEQDDNEQDNNNLQSPKQPIMMCLAQHFVGLSVQKRRAWIEQHPTLNNGTITPANLTEWLMDNPYWNIRVFSKRGIVLWALEENTYGNRPDMWSGLQDEPRINLLWNGHWSYIKSLRYKFGLRSDQIFCNICKRAHTKNKDCRRHVAEAETTALEVRFQPQDVKHYVVIYADFESIIDPHTKRHQLAAYGWLAIIGNEVVKREYATKNDQEYLIEHFLDSLLAFARRLARLPANPGMPNTCTFCGQVFDGNYITGKNYFDGQLGKYHMRCWVSGRYKNYLPVLFHNFKGYDSHLLLAAALKLGKCNILAKSMNKFDAFTMQTNDGMVSLKFLDTFNHLSQSLDALSKQLSAHVHSQQRNKAPFPYDWFDSFDKLNEPLPRDPLLWWNDLTQTTGDVDAAVQVYEAEHMERFEDYLVYYLVHDVELLADVFEAYRRNVMDAAHVDCIYYTGAPSLTWNVATFKNLPAFKVVDSKEIYYDITANIRGGVAQCALRYAEKNSPEDYFVYLDINSLYSYCMMQKLPGKFIETLRELPEDWEATTTNDSPICYLIKCDLHYPEHLHDRDVDYPLCPHKYNDRLCATFADKEDILLHARNLQFYLQKGLVLIQVHYVYVFEQDYILRDYVTENIEKRKATRDKGMQDLYKLLNNSLYGKTCENVFKYKEYKHKKVTDENVGQPVNRWLGEAKSWQSFNDATDFIIETLPQNVELKKPVQIGFTILEFAKIEIQRYWYDIIDCFGQNVRMLYTDTDSMLMKFINQPRHPLQTFMRFPKLASKLDMEVVPDDWPIKTTGTYKVAGLWSDEADFKEITGFIGLRAKSYICRFANGGYKSRNKGIRKTARHAQAGRALEWDDFKSALFDNKRVYVTQYGIAARKHDLKTAFETKLALSSVDEKRLVLGDKITTVPFGYKGQMYRDDPAVYLEQAQVETLPAHIYEEFENE